MYIHSTKEMMYMHFGTSKSILSFVLTVLAGVAVGSVLVVLYPERQIWQNAVFRQGIGLTGAGWGALMGYAFLGLGVLAVLGLSVLGTIGAYVVLLIRGMALGAVLGEMYARNGFAGFLTALLFVMPYAFGSILILLLAARETCRSAGWILACLTDKDTERFSGKMYALRYMVLVALLFLLTIAQHTLLRFAYPVFLDAMIHA